jgi:hypothetical protein
LRSAPTAAPPPLELRNGRLLLRQEKATPADRLAAALLAALISTRRRAA